jgi:cytochrome bd ubiquinol oxidase subunit II
VRAIDGMFAVASLVTPFALGAAAGGIAAERVPVGNAAGNLITSWLNPTSILIGLLAVAFSAYLAAGYLAADAAAREEPDLVEAFRRRALAAGAVAGGLALAGLIVVHADDHPLYSGLVHGAALAVLILSVVVGTTTMGLNTARRFELARYTGALAVALVIADWALARSPTLLPGLTVDQAAAPHDTMVAVVVAVLAGAVLLFPALALLFTLTLRGDLGGHAGEAEPLATPAQSGAAQLLLGPTLGARLAVALLIVGIGLLNVADGPWAHAIGVISLLAFVLVAFAALVPRALAEDA